MFSEHPDEQPHNNTIEIDIEVAADNDRHDSQMITQDISDDDNDDANADEDDDDDDDDDDRNHGMWCNFIARVFSSSCLSVISRI